MLLLISIIDFVDQEYNFISAHSLDVLKENPSTGNIENTITQPSYSIQPFQTPRILFIVGDPNSLDPNIEEIFVDRLNLTLNYEVVLHDDNGSYSYSNFDAIVISGTVVEEGSPSFIESLYTAPIPILTLEHGNYNEFELGSGSSYLGALPGQIWILNNSHYITAGYPDPSLKTETIIYTASGELDAVTGFDKNKPSGCQILELAQTSTSPAHSNRRNLVVLEKGEKDWQLNPAAERRAFWGGVGGNLFTFDGWKLWERTVKWILYDDDNGNATINVNTIDLNGNPVSNANVTLVNSSDPTDVTTHYTDQNGITFFSKNFGTYDIIAEYDQYQNLTFLNQEIAGTRTFHREALFNYDIILPFSLNKDPPIVENITFQNISGTYAFYADVLDIDPIDTVLLNMTVYNTSNYLEPYISPKNYTMRPQSGNPGDSGTYFNDTALDSLNHTAVEVLYSLIANDSVGNVTVTPIRSLILEDLDAPIIHGYNARDYGNGSIEFWANISDPSSVQDPVYLKINSDIYEMHMNTSGLWTYKGLFYYDSSLNYTLYSINDTLGNENGSKLFPLKIGFKLMNTSDINTPHIWGLTDTLVSHEEGYVEFTVFIDDWNEWQSGLNKSSVTINLTRNENTTSYKMTPIGAVTFYFNFTFEFGENVSYQIFAFDYEGNYAESDIHGYNIIGDNAIPVVSYWAEEWGNGTIDYYATVSDWPDNDTDVFLHYALDWFEDWQNETMTKIEESFYYYRVNVPNYQSHDTWYYVSAKDSEQNLNDPTKDNAYNITLTDNVEPLVFFTIENSTLKDGEITVVAYATDPFGVTYYVTNSFYLNVTHQLTLTTYEMSYNDFFRYNFTLNFPYNDVVTFTVFVKDNANNQGEKTKTITMMDHAPPKILRYGEDDYQNGTVTIWAEIKEGEYGSGLPEDNSSVFFNYVFGTDYTVPMSWNGTGNFYSYSVNGLKPENAFAYNISAEDLCGNIIETSWKVYSVGDSINPKILDHGISQTLVNHTHSEIHCWLEGVDPFGTLNKAIFTISYLKSGIVYYFTAEMEIKDSRYEYTLTLLCNIQFNFTLKLLDNAANEASIFEQNQKTLDYYPTKIINYGLEFPQNISYIGNVKFWMSVENPFNDQIIRISIHNDDDSFWLVTNSTMVFNGTHYVFTYPIDYMTSFSYYIWVIDPGSIGGYYFIAQRSNNTQMLDHWGPVIQDVFLDHKNDSVTFWANISDWGSGIENVFVHWMIKNPDLAGLGAKLSTTIKPMNKFNETFYFYSLTINTSGILEWYVTASDISGNDNKKINIENLREDPIFLDNQINSTPNNEFFGVLTLFIFVGALIGIITMFVGIKYRNASNEQRARAISYNERLNLISNIYYIIVATDAGIPVFNATNLYYYQEEDMKEILSGLSVTIDTFLSSFQDDFIGYIQGVYEDLESDDKKDIRLSLIEQNRIQIFIAASSSYRIFIFMKEKPSDYIKKIFYQIIDQLESQLKLSNFGVINERIVSPKIFNIIRTHFPINLLSPFKIDMKRLAEIDSLARSGQNVSISMSALKALKRLFMVKSTTNISINDEEVQIKAFDVAVANNQIIQSNVMIYDEALKIFKNVLKIESEQIFEAFWIGSRPDVNIIRPEPENIFMK
ncbi:MAG: hypothetical protein ACFE95_02180 [Candidatus Hodarchaeota archaeon]